MEALHLEKNRWTVRDITLTAGLASAPRLLAEGVVNILAFYGLLKPLQKLLPPARK